MKKSEIIEIANIIEELKRKNLEAFKEIKKQVYEAYNNKRKG